MKKIFYLLSLSLLICCNGNQNTRLEEALSWVPEKSEMIFFDDWKQIKTDFGFSRKEFVSCEWMPNPVNELGQEIPEEIKKDNFGPYAASRFYEYTLVPGTIDKIGILYPDMEWEIEGTNLTHVFKMNPDFNEARLDSLLHVLQYRSIEYGKFIIHYHKQDPEFYGKNNAIWFALSSAVCYIPDEKVLLIAPEIEFLKENLDAHAKNKNFLNKPGINDILSELNNMESAFISEREYGKDPSKLFFGTNASESGVMDLKANLHQWMGLTSEELKSLHTPQLYAVGEEKGGKVKSILWYSDASVVTQEEKLRLKMLKEGRNIRTRMELKEIFFNTSSASKGNKVVLNWEVEPNSTAIIQGIQYNDMIWLLSPN